MKSKRGGGRDRAAKGNSPSGLRRSCQREGGRRGSGDPPQFRLTPAPSGSGKSDVSSNHDEYLARE